jgi:hypothetical protein
MVVVFRGDAPPGLAEERLVWYGDEGAIEIGVDAQGVVLWKRFVPWPGSGSSLVGQVLRILGLP